MIDPERWAEVRRLKRQEGYSIRGIARQLNLDRKTVRKILQQEHCPGSRPPKPVRRGSILDPYRADIRRYLKEKPPLSAVQIHRRLTDLHGYRGEITLVRRYIQEIRQAEGDAFLRLTFLPGECAQVDWASFGSLPVDNTVRRLSAFVMVLAYSRLMYAEFTLSEKMDAFLEAHVRAFQAFGGVPRRLLYDNCKTVVLDRQPGAVRFHPRLLELADHYLFAVRVCPPRRAWHKGRVESGIGYMRKSFDRGRPSPMSLEAEQNALHHWVNEVANERLHRVTRRKPRELFEEAEQSVLGPLPETAFETDHIVPSISVNSYFRVHYDGNQYSVPYRYAHRRGLLLKATTQTVRIFVDGECIAAHPRSYGRGVDVLDDEHQRGLIEKKRRAERNTLLGRVVAVLGQEAETYATGLVRASVQTPRHLRRLLALADSYGANAVRKAMHQAMAHNAFGADYIENIIHQRRRQSGQKPLLSPSITDQDLNNITVPLPDLSHFDRLVTEPERNPLHDLEGVDSTKQEKPHRPDPEPQDGSRRGGKEPELPWAEESR